MRTRAFTLIECLVAIAVMGLLMALALTSFSGARDQSKRITCLANQSQIALAITVYTNTYDGLFPIAQYYDQAHFALVAWDTMTYVDDPKHARPGLIWEYNDGGAVQQCPSFSEASMTSGDVFTGYNYNTTYIGRGENEGAYRGMGTAPANLSQVRFPGRAALIGDGGWSGGANKFMRAPLDAGVAEGAVHSGAQAYRHGNRTNVVYIDGHGQSTDRRFRKPSAQPFNEGLLRWPNNGFLSPDDKAYAHR